MEENKELEFLLNACLNDALCMGGIRNTNNVSKFVTGWLEKQIDTDWFSLCPDCNNKMTKVRDGKYQCDTINCTNS